MNQVCLFLICPPELEYTLSDWLLEQEYLTGFTSIEVKGHGSDPASLNLIEQVQGRKKLHQYQIHLTEDDLARILNDLQASFAGTSLHYWVSPVSQSGVIGHTQ